MIQVLLGRKIRTTQRFTKDGKRVPVTIVEAGPCTVVQVKGKDKDGYGAVQLAFGLKKKGNKPIKGHMKKANLQHAPLFLQEVRIEEVGQMKVGDVITVEQVFQKGDKIFVTGTSKGKGFTGVMKRFGFAGGPKTHGQSDRERAPGSIGSGTTPGRVWKGKKMPGRAGGDTVTVKGLKVFDMDTEKNLLMIQGVIPGSPKGFVRVTKA